MSDEHDDGSTDELTPEQESTVRRLLSEARHDQPLPSAVSDRLDRVLADLSEGQPAVPVVDLAARRRRRNAGRLLVAAAAVILAGVGIGQVLGSAERDDSSADSASMTEQAPDRASSDDHSQDGATADEPNAAGADGGAGGESMATQGLAQALPLNLSSASLSQDVQDQLGALPSATRSDLASLSVDSGTNFLATTAGFSCDPPVPATTYAKDELLPAYYDGVPVVLALRAEPDGTQEGQLLECSTGTSVASFSITLR